MPGLSRSLLTPGPLPPLSHLGVTLLRHVVGTGLRYALYQLGLPVPEAPPVRIVRLRLYLDEEKLLALLAGRPGGAEMAAALSDPGGVAVLPRATRLAAAAAFHRVRLRLVGHRVPVSLARMPRKGDAASRLVEFRATLSTGLARTNDALLADLVAALGRRARRARGAVLPPVRSRAAQRLLAGRGVNMRRFGPPDLLLPSWATSPQDAAQARRLVASAADSLESRATDPLRGCFREAYRGLLDRLAPLYRAVADHAVAGGLLAEPDDAFFLPLDLTADLALARPPSWLAGAVRANRAERESARSMAIPPERISGPEDTVVRLGAGRGWEAAPLLPLP